MSAPLRDVRVRWAWWMPAYAVAIWTLSKLPEFVLRMIGTERIHRIAGLVVRGIRFEAIR